MTIVIRCPYCLEQKTEEELTYGGEAGIARGTQPHLESDLSWTDYLFMRSNIKGLVVELWCCTVGCRHWFQVQRDSVTHEIGEVQRLGIPRAGALSDHDLPGDGIPGGPLS